MVLNCVFLYRDLGSKPLQMYHINLSFNKIPRETKFPDVIFRTKMVLYIINFITYEKEIRNSKPSSRSF